MGWAKYDEDIRETQQERWAMQEWEKICLPERKTDNKGNVREYVL